MPSFFFSELQLITVLLLISNSYKSLSTRCISLKLCLGFSIFDSISFLSKFMFLFIKMCGLRHNSVQNYYNKEAIHTLATRPLNFKLQ